MKWEVGSGKWEVRGGAAVETVASAVETAPGGDCGRHETDLRRLGHDLQRWTAWCVSACEGGCPRAGDSVASCPRAEGRWWVVGLDLHRSFIADMVAQSVLAYASMARRRF